MSDLVLSIKDIQIAELNDQIAILVSHLDNHGVRFKQIEKKLDLMLYLVISLMPKLNEDVMKTL
jgi:hypothetical protein